MNPTSKSWSATAIQPEKEICTLRLFNAVLSLPDSMGGLAC